VTNPNKYILNNILAFSNILQLNNFLKVKRFFYASSACVYASWHQRTNDKDIALKEADAYPADPEDGYGWEKLFGERMCRHFSEDFGLEVRIGRYHNIYGPFGTYEGGREKAPAAAARKISIAKLSKISTIEMWGDGQQVRSFTYIEDCIEGTMRLMNSAAAEPINIGSAESVSIQNLYDITAQIANLEDLVYTYNSKAPQGVRGRSSDNTKCLAELGWAPTITLIEGMTKTYSWVLEEIQKKNEKSN